MNAARRRPPHGLHAAGGAWPPRRPGGRSARLTLLVAAVLGAAMVPAHAQDAAAQALQVHALAATCAACHGTDGRAGAASAMPALAGRSAAWLAEQMQAFKSGARPATVMHQIARGYSEAQIRQIAAFFAAQPP